MNLTAKISREWRNRMLFVFVFEILFAAWFFYDGLVTYPKYNLKADAYIELAKTNPNADEAALKSKWEMLAQEKGWDTKELPKQRKNEAQQIHFAVGLLVCALLFALWVVREMRRKIVANDETFTGITTGIPPFNFLETVQFSSIVGLDKRKWDKKGIACVFSRRANGSRKRYIIDDYKYAGTEAILNHCESIIAKKKSSQ